jgi:hypothetical protein
MSSIGTVVQPVINNSSGEMAGTVNLDSEYVDVTCSSSALPSAPGSQNASGNFVKITFTNSGEYCSVRSDAAVGHHFIIKNVSAITGYVALYHGTGATASSSINGIATSANNDYMLFNLSSGKKLSIYVKTAQKISVTYL